MVTCFIFLKYLTDEGCLSLCLNQQGELHAPLAERTFSEIKQLQLNAKTIAVVSTEYVGLHSVELPWLPEKKARAALPFALEDKLAENVDELHFAFARQFYQNGRYLVIICNKSWLMDILATLEDHHIHFDNITLDWFALDDNETCILSSSLLTHNEPFFSGALAEELAISYLKDLSLDQTIYTFTDSDPLLLAPTAQVTGIESLLWIAKRLHVKKTINLSQGPLEQSSSHFKTKRWYLAAATMSLLWVAILLIGNGLKIYSLNSQVSEVDKQIATVYRQFFPKAQQIISPRFRISQLLKSRKNDTDKAFWSLLNQLTEAITKNNSKVEQLRFQNQLLQVTVVSKDFDTLEAVQTALQKASVKVKQSQAASTGDKVTATLELSL
ncbi:MAG: type II secretion system protein GspL [Legionella sp.]|nr:type II secretion system protein GspL [Legionella sp.]